MTFTTSLRRRTALVLGLLALAPLELSPALAQTRNNLVDVRVINRDTGEVLRTWRHEGRLYVAGEPGTRYGLRFSNRTGGRILAVASVDGVNIVTGETANYDQRGYVLSPWQTTEVNGWRKSDLGLLWRPAYFTGGYAVHGSLSVPPFPASHGCVRLTMASMNRLYDRLPVGTPVLVYRT